MPLPTRNPALQAIHRRLSQGQSYRALAGAMDDDQGVQAETAGGQVVRQQAELEALFPPGFFCKHPSEAETVVLPDGAGHVIVGWRLALPSAVAQRAVSQPCLYDDQGNRLELNGTSGGAAKMAAGKFKVHNGGTCKAVALNGDDCIPSGAFMTWLGTLVTAINGLGGVVSAWSGASLADVSATSAKLEAE
jgi:hypothetical protein